jgi:hypothetical protein
MDFVGIAGIRLWNKCERVGAEQLVVRVGQGLDMRGLGVWTELWWREKSCS